MVYYENEKEKVEGELKQGKEENAVFFCSHWTISYLNLKTEYTRKKNIKGIFFYFILFFNEKINF